MTIVHAGIMEVHRAEINWHLNRNVVKVRADLITLQPLSLYTKTKLLCFRIWLEQTIADA